MIIHIEESGGFAGIKRSIKINTNDLPKDQAEKITEIIRNLDLDNELPCGSQRHPGAADYVNYSVSINDNGITKARQYDQKSAPQEIMGLVKYISKINAAKSKD